MTKTTYNFNGRKEYINKNVLDTAPTGLNTDIKFFKLDKSVSDGELEKEYESRGLEPATLESICEYEKNTKDKMDEMMYVGTHWKDAKGNWCYAAFNCWDDEREVYVSRYAYDWRDRWWFAGVRKSSEISSSEHS
jgi:hypothetical protein